ncbi:MAG TPA: hypothetical protein VNC18_14900 [Gemmatimonadaceae bacterium]|jgi:hypothetical protein|nr:hypothetical protein [Gemmatimonadaceae bacterium]
MIPLVIGAALAVVALGYVLYPIFFGGRPEGPAATGVVDDATIVDATVDEEIEAAVRAYRSGEQKNDRCAACGTPVVARDARYCSTCGNRLA